ncbi:hypothetical protein LTR99_009390 [Exophiala xenobiotica]|uniref:Galactosyl transferase GMA12/MNN10 family protein n=1 Tax=Vermiconidia calcicola TaxID=1690605 RepID=A0AAV9PX39_9PEZI|nr:hypothetical protein LTR92_002217 [Exophiala xenobiotica]KAK5530934.1 hypothetical protein LTR25_008791 [Vermiconidia calcicola]KAK5544426.1 hypothetical protein LTR23_004514 [Chaetothyriales sp. CCFEE 6169]KAK5269051.1 hypothetical protein LTR96_005835 [Exophiala xenobiotica]KAK5294584.1 hypothetical protein LTR99_009390 [Exophiala xenobiotica]
MAVFQPSVFMPHAHNSAFRWPHRLGRIILLAVALVILLIYATKSSWEQSLDFSQLPAVAQAIETSAPFHPPVLVENEADSAKGVPSSSSPVESERPTATPSPEPIKALTDHDEDLSPSGEGALYSKIGKVTMLYYDKVSKDSVWFEKALAGHKAHNLRFGYKHFVLRHEIVPDVWSKQAFILSILLQELAKPMADRLEWLFWHDADLVLMNAQLPLEMFVPPDTFSHVHHLVANDLNGLNAGVFFLRVHEWSMWYLSAVMSYTTYNPDKQLRYSEQTAMEWLIQDKWGMNTTHIPQRWFNAYQDYGTDDTVPPEWEWKHGYYQPGDLLVHLPGTGDARPDTIKEWLDRVRDENLKYEIPLANTAHMKNITEFWANDARKEKENQDTYWRRWHILIEVGSQQDDLQREAVKDTEQHAVEYGLSEDAKETKLDEVKEKYKLQKIAALRQAERKKLQDEGLIGKDLEVGTGDEETKDG